jgi:hypothetical protein
MVLELSLGQSICLLLLSNANRPMKYTKKGHHSKLMNPRHKALMHYNRKGPHLHSMI